MTDDRMLEEERKSMYRGFVKTSGIAGVTTGIILLLMFLFLV